MNPLFADLDPSTIDSIEDQLSNNENASSEELIDFFIEELGITSEQAEAAVTLRTQYLQHIFLSGTGPLHQADGLKFDPTIKQFV